MLVMQTHGQAANVEWSQIATVIIGWQCRTGCQYQATDTTSVEALTCVCVDRREIEEEWTSQCVPALQPQLTGSTSGVKQMPEHMCWMGKPNKYTAVTI